MKTFLVLVALSLNCHAQSLTWELSIPNPPTSVVTNSTLFPDGTGGAAILLTTVTPTGNVARAVWASSQGNLNAIHDFEIFPSLASTNRALAQAHYEEFRRNTGQFSDEQIATDAVIDAFFAAPPATRFNILRVTSKVLDVQTVNAEGHTVITRFVKGKAPKELTLANSETLVTLPQSVPDKRWFFTVQLSNTNMTVRRYTF